MKPANAIGLSPLTARNRAWLLHGQRPVLGEQHLAILTAVQALASLNAAAQLGVELITARTGGHHGGGSRLTADRRTVGGTRGAMVL